ncbi:hypothetical protein [Aquamicrobium defluvii]|uniref:hypothetical protein n=1 Tax=Aquamicrobium defluvii TaxID=69279 RepID=UPI0004B41890|nr:hypothetical protein [Aquamicrobium defluvii]
MVLAPISMARERGLGEGQPLPVVDRCFRQRGFAAAANAMTVQAVDIRRIRSNLEGPVNHRFLLLGEQSIGES